MRPQARLLALFPITLVAILTLWSGTFHGAATGAGAVASQAMILGGALWGIVGMSDPLRLGQPGRWLVPVMMTVVMASWWLSPVSRAGTIGLILLPAVVLIPSSTARCWAEEARRGLGSASLAALTLVVSVIALARWQTLSLPRASLPLGHHNLLACWLVLVLPLTASGLIRPGWPRWLAMAGSLSGLLTLVATGSLLGAIAAVVQLLIAAYWWPRLRLWATSLASIGVLIAAPRLWSILQATDPSFLARGSYLAAGWKGLISRPAVGWGPGAVPWTVAEFMEPVVGVHPASEVIGDLHSLPIQIAYELGGLGLLLSLTLVGLFALRRWRECSTRSAPASRRTALLGLIGGGVFALGAAPLAVPAIPVTAAVIAGASFGKSNPPLWRGRVAVAWAYTLFAVVLLTPLDRAHLLYDQARHAQSAAESQSTLLQAHEIDPAFPLYLARESWLAADNQGVDLTIADRAHEAAQMAPGLAPLWLEAGILGYRVGASWAPEALVRAHQLDPLSPLTAFHRMTVTLDLATATRLGSEALTGEPRLAAAEWWLESPELARAVSQKTHSEIPPPRGTPQSRPMVLALSFDNSPALSFSLFAFRRAPWPGSIGRVDLGAD